MRNLSLLALSLLLLYSLSACDDSGGSKADVDPDLPADSDLLPQDLTDIDPSDVPIDVTPEVDDDTPETCTPDCADKACGPDGCGGICGDFLTSDCDGTTLRLCQDGVIQPFDCAASGDVCQEKGQGGHHCVDPSCTPECTGKACGPDGCGGVCGDFLTSDCDGTTLRLCQDGVIQSVDCAAAGDVCQENGQGGHHCVDPGCTPECTGNACGSDGCSGVCGEFLTSDCDGTTLRLCQDGVIQRVDCGESGDICQEDGQGGHHCACLPNCTGRACGDDGCGGICGEDLSSECQGDLLRWCDDGVIATEHCSTSGESCREDGQGGHHCVCVPDCDGKSCGPDGCGGICGSPLHSACQGQTLTTCVDGAITTVNCATLDGVCSESVTQPGTFACSPAAMRRLPSSGATTTYAMGCPTLANGDGWCESDAQPSHSVTLSAYFIDRYEVSTTEYQLCVNNGPCTAAATGANYNAGVLGRGNHPINGVTWSQAKAYCEWVGKRLPTEAEWERAAKGPDHQRFPWGNSCPNSWGTYCSSLEWGLSTAKANGDDFYTGDGFAATAPVGSFLLGSNNGASPDGLLDMAGNVAEWTADWYGATTYTAAAAVNPTGPSTGTQRVVRGGGWNSTGPTMRTSARHSLAPTSYGTTLGFRCAKTVD